MQPLAPRVLGLPTLCSEGKRSGRFDRGSGVRRPHALTCGINPIGWMAGVAYVRALENRSHGSSLGGKLRRFCNGTRFRYVFR
jgi:hypothetical protein